MRYTLDFRKGAGAYDLSARYWKCTKCGLEKRPDKYCPRNPRINYCQCK